MLAQQQALVAGNQYAEIGTGQTGKVGVKGKLKKL